MFYVGSLFEVYPGALVNDSQMESQRCFEFMIIIGIVGNHVTLFLPCSGNVTSGTMVKIQSEVSKGWIFHVC